MFKINPKVYSSMFSLPTEIIDKGLKFATGEQLKVILCIFRNPEATIEDIAKKTNLSNSEIEECVEYWQGAGVLDSQEVEKTVQTEALNKEIKEKVKMPLPEIRFSNPTQEEIEKILKKNGSMKRLFNEAQQILGNTIGYTMQCTIYAVVYRYGIKPDVANCLLYFAKSIEKTSQNDIMSIAKYWAENDITTLSAADDYIRESEKAVALFKDLAKKTNNDLNVPSFAVLEVFSEWIRWGYGIDLVEKAFDIMKAEKETGRLVWNNVCHMNGTIKKWRSSGITTLEDLEKGTKKFSTKSQRTNNKETSFDVDLAEKQAREGTKDFGSMKNKKRRRA
jgi:DNA replication protein DnaD